MLSTLSIKALSILIIVLNSQFDNSNIPAISDSHACSVFSNCFLPFGVPCNFSQWPDMIHHIKGMGCE